MPGRDIYNLPLALTRKTRSVQIASLQSHLNNVIVPPRRAHHADSDPSGRRVWSWHFLG
jgi:hypothetical protein